MLMRDLILEKSSFHPLQSGDEYLVERVIPIEGIPF